MHNDPMPLNIATASPQKAALAHGGFFAFALHGFPPSSFMSLNPCLCPLPRPNPLTACHPRRSQQPRVPQSVRALKLK
jgi:hypothetical protein